MDFIFLILIKSRRIIINNPEMINILYLSLVSETSTKPYILARPMVTAVNDHTINIQDAPNARENTEAAS